MPEDASDNFRFLARQALMKAERAVSPNVRSRHLLMAAQWNSRASEIERSAHNVAIDGRPGSAVPDEPPPSA